MISLIVPITKEMLPSFRIVAYYHTDDNEVVSDSVWVDVKDSCMGSVRHTDVAKFEHAPLTNKKLHVSFIDVFFKSS